MYAVIDDRGKQYKVNVDEEFLVDLLDAEEGTMAELGRVLMVGGDEDAGPKIGTPELPGARVLVEILRHEKGPKLRIPRYRSDRKSKSAIGHRQRYTRVLVREIHPE